MVGGPLRTWVFLLIFSLEHFPFHYHPNQRMEREKRNRTTNWLYFAINKQSDKVFGCEISETIYLLLFFFLNVRREKGTKKKVFLPDFIYPHLPGSALSSTVAHIPRNMEIKCLFYFYLGSLRYLAGQWAEVGGPVLVSHGAFSSVPCIAAEEMELPSRPIIEAGCTLVGIGSVLIGIHCCSFSDMPPVHPRFLWSHYYY